jgi:hypothetical protein
MAVRWGDSKAAYSEDSTAVRTAQKSVAWTARRSAVLSEALKAGMTVAQTAPRWGRQTVDSKAALTDLRLVDRTELTRVAPKAVLKAVLWAPSTVVY